MSEEIILKARDALQKGDFGTVIGLLKPLLSSMPDNTEIRSILTEAQEGMMLRIQLTQKVEQAKDLLQSGDREGAGKAVESILKVDPGNPDALNLKRLLQIPETENVNATVAFDFNDQLGETDFNEAPQETQLKSESDGLESLEPFELSFDTQEQSTKESGVKKVEEEPLEAFGWEDSSLAGNSKVQGFPADSIEGSDTPASGNETVTPFPMDSLGEYSGSEEETHLSSPQEVPFSLGGEENKVENFLAEGKRLIAAQKYQDAIDVLTRVFILDEENKEAQVLIDEAKEKLQNIEQKVNLILNEAISAYDTQNYEKAKELFSKVLEIFPGHREADYYLKEIELKSQNTGFQLEQEVADYPNANFEKQDNFTFDTGSVAGDLSSLVGTPKQEPVKEVSSPQEVILPKPETETLKAKIPKIAKKEKKQIPVGLIAGVVAGLILIGGSFFVIPVVWQKLFTPKTVAQKIPTQPKKIETKQPEAKLQQKSVEPQKTLSDILLEANAAMQAKQYEKAVNLYTQAESMSKFDLEIKSKLETAKIELAKQQEEEARIQRFVSDYEKAVKYFKMSEYGEAVRISWRLIYPKDQEAFAVQMGKADSIKKIIRNGYFNWAIKDLKAGNPVIAKKNLQDLLDFDPRDSKARELLSFADKYTKVQKDEDYRQKVQDLSYRSIDE